MCLLMTLISIRWIGLSSDLSSLSIEKKLIIEKHSVKIRREIKGKVRADMGGVQSVNVFQHQKYSAGWPLLLQRHHRNNNVIAELNQPAQTALEICLEPESHSLQTKFASKLFSERALNQSTKQLNDNY